MKKIPAKLKRNLYSVQPGKAAEVFLRVFCADSLVAQIPLLDEFQRGAQHQQQ